MSDDDLLLQTFDEELRRSVKESQGLLLSLDESPSKAADVHEVYRLAHSVKGASRVVGLGQIESIAHLLESQLQSLVRTESLPEAPLIDLFVESLDGMVSAFDAFLTGDVFDEEPLVHRLEAYAAKTPPVPSITDRRTSAPTGDELASRAPDRRHAPPVAAPPKELPSATRRDESVRVPTTVVDELFRKIEEAFLLESRIGSGLSHWEETHPGLSDARGLLRSASRLHQVLLQAHGLVRAFRMEAFDTLRIPVQKAVRELSLSLAKPVRVVFSGRAELVDASLLDGLQEPLLHVVRNAMDHGIENASQRARAQKNPEAVIEVRGEVSGGYFLLSVRDDGRGFSVDRIKATAIAKGLVLESEVASWSMSQWLDLPFRSGFTTAEVVTAVSGRGLGLDIVRDRVRRLGGDVSLSTGEGMGTTVTMRVPAGALTMRMLLVRCGERQAAIPIENIERVTSPKLTPLRNVEGQTIVEIEGGPVPVRYLNRILGWEGRSDAGVLVILRFGEVRRCFAVDEALSQVEQAVFPTPWSLRSLPHLGAVMLASDGQVIPVIEPSEAFKRAEGQIENLGAPPTPDHSKRRVLVVDDSSTLRMLHRSMLVNAGFDVLGA
ncbi:MAG: ATP-binding protein, partial [Vicinamibacteria bacterium]